MRKEERRDATNARHSCGPLGLGKEPISWKYPTPDESLHTGLSRESPLESAERMWVEVQQTLIHHPKTKRLARLLGIPRMQAVGHMVALWCWCVDYAPDGELGDVEDYDVADAAGWDGPCETFVQAIFDAGFLDQGGAVHDWNDYTGGKLQELERRREGNRKRQQALRERHALRSRVTNALVTGTPYLTEPYRTEPNHAEPTAPLAGSRQRYPEDFEAFWNAYGPTNGPKKPAFVAWQRLSKADKAEAVAGLGAWLHSRKWRDGFKDYPQKYLNQRFWEADAGADAKAQANGHAPAVDADYLRRLKAEMEELQHGR